jgi:hypothetical protein
MKVPISPIAMKIRRIPMPIQSNIAQSYQLLPKKQKVIAHDNCGISRHRLFAPNQQGDDKSDQEHKESSLRNPRSWACHACKTKQAGQHRNNQKKDSPTYQHFFS